MSEFGSSKSFSSVSEPSSSQPSSSDGPPPDSSSSHSSGEPSSSSDEVHTCHRCGNCCYSDKSIKTRNVKPTLAGDIGGMAAFMAQKYNDLPNFSFQFGIFVPCGFSYISEPFAYQGNTYRIVENAEGAPAAFVQEWNDGTMEWEDVMMLFEHYDGPVSFDCCKRIYNSYRDWTSMAGNDGEDTALDVVYEVHNNPCCRDTITDECFQHFGGDCRGDCDEPSSSSESSESSGENPLP